MIRISCSHLVKFCPILPSLAQTWTVCPIPRSKYTLSGLVAYTDKQIRRTTDNFCPLLIVRCPLSIVRKLQTIVRFLYNMSKKMKKIFFLKYDKLDISDYSYSKLFKIHKLWEFRTKQKIVIKITKYRFLSQFYYNLKKII